MRKVALVTAIEGHGGTYLAELLLRKDYMDSSRDFQDSGNS